MSETPREQGSYAEGVVANGTGLTLWRVTKHPFSTFEPSEQIIWSFTVWAADEAQIRETVREAWGSAMGLTIQPLHVRTLDDLSLRLTQLRSERR